MQAVTRKKERENAREFLECVGVREVGFSEKIKFILERRYANPDLTPNWESHVADLKRFINFWKKDRATVDLFKEYTIFQSVNGGWSRPSDLYLDSPYLDTDLSAYYSRLGSESELTSLSDRYKKFPDLEHLVCFAKACGVVSCLEIKVDSCRNSPEKKYLLNAPGEKITDGEVDQDFYVPKLATLLKKPALDISRLVWKTLRDQSKDGILKAIYRKNASNDARTSPSRLLLLLREAAWIPQEDNHQNVKFTRPADASRDMLPKGFPFDSDWNWLDAVGFGKETKERIERARKDMEDAERLGFRDESALTDGRRFGELDPKIRREFLDKQKMLVELPVRDSDDPRRRAERVRKEAREAPERERQKRMRSVLIQRDRVKREKAEPYLRNLYTNDDGVTICQACREPLPFRRLSDGKYYFETVEFLPELERHYHQNYLALCPNYAAMFKHANESKEVLKDLFLNMNGNDLELTLAGRTVTLYFTELHRDDLEAVIKVDEEK